MSISLYKPQWFRLNRTLQVLEVSLRGSFNEQNIEHPQRLLRVTKKIFRQGYGHMRAIPKATIQTM